ncbi:helix-turn-helix domain-containing protein [Halobaculum roseum]|uniref:Helix-turn-helix domain-containing protein n=1 Tax=Halobaculum roseum TaxID=2175149 RepID=A0ABD5MQD2_9EURY|nr:endonuclease I [Halobaculum roseum]
MRYEWLDESIDELAERYDAGQSLREIADEFGVSTPTIHNRLKDHDVSMRNGGPEYVRLEHRTDELVAQYVDHDRSAQAIADDYNTSRAAIRYHLEQAGVDYTPPASKTADLDFNPYQVSLIQGELLGDGCLHRRTDEGCFFQLSTTTESHAVRLIENLPESLFPDGQPNKFTRENHFNGEDYTMWTVTSRPQSRFEQLYEDWYEVREENNRKVVPEAFTLDRTALLHWYWGDGSCSIRDRGAPRVSFATHGFPEASVEHLRSELDRLGYDNYAVEQTHVEDGSGLFIRLRDYDARSFLEDFRRFSSLPEYDHKFPVPIREDESV